MSMQHVMKVLLTRPQGAKAHEIADEAGISVSNVSDALRRLLKKSNVRALTPHTNRLQPVWVSTVIVEKRKSFGGAEALIAMQAVAKDRYSRRAA